MGKLVYDGKSVYEIDEDCLRKKEERERQKEMEWQRKESEKNKTVSYTHLTLPTKA